MFISSLNVVQEMLEVFDDFWWADDGSFLAETANPRVEHVADFYLCGNGEVIVVGRSVENVVRTEPIDHRVQKIVREPDLHLLLLATVHGEHSLGVGSQVYLVEHLATLSWLRQFLHVLHAVDAIIDHLLAVVGQQIEVAVRHQNLEGTQLVEDALATWRLLGSVLQGVFHVTKLDFVVVENGSVDGLHILRQSVVAVLDAVNQIRNALQFVLLVFTALFRQRIQQTFLLLFGDEPRRTNTLHQ